MNIIEFQVFLLNMGYKVMFLQYFEGEEIDEFGILFFEFVCVNKVLNLLEYSVGGEYLLGIYIILGIKFLFWWDLGFDEGERK